MSDPHRLTSWDYTVRKEETMDEMEMVFLKDFWELMDAAHYSCLSEVEWLAVKQERLLLDMPLRINWDHMETRLLARFFSRNPMRSEGLFRCAAHACWNRAHCRCCVAGPWLSVAVPCVQLADAVLLSDRWHHWDKVPLGAAHFVSRDPGVRLTVSVTCTEQAAVSLYNIMSCVVRDIRSSWHALGSKLACNAGNEHGSVIVLQIPRARGAVP
jgi:hypothetical protein